MTNQFPKYIVVLKDASGNAYDFEKATNIKWEKYENSVGRCMFELPYTDLKLEQALSNDEQMFEILIYRNGVLKWQGYLAFILDTIDKTAIYGLDFMECMKWYRCTYNTTYTDKKIGSEIISPEWDTIAGRANIVLGTRITKGTIENPYTTGTTSEKTIKRVTFNEDFFSLVAEMQQLSASDSPSGAWEQNSVFEVTQSETAPTFNFWRNKGSNQADVVFELGSEIVDYYIPKDYRFINNDLIGYSIISGPSIITKTSSDATSISKFYRRELSPVFGALTKQEELDAKVANFMKENKDPKRDIRIAFAAGLTPFDGYSMGDNVQIKIKRGRFDIKEYMRVVGMEVTVDNSGAEQVSPVVRKLRT